MCQAVWMNGFTMKSTLSVAAALLVVSCQLVTRAVLGLPPAEGFQNCGMCTCLSGDNNTIIADCRDRELTEFPDDLPDDVGSLLLFGNEMQLLQRTRTFTSLESITGAKSSVITADALHGMPALKELELTTENATLSENLFSHSHNLETLRLIIPNVVNLSRNLFKDIKNSTLSLEIIAPSLQDIHPDIFSRFVGLNKLSLILNGVDTIPSALFIGDIEIDCAKFGLNSFQCALANSDAKNTVLRTIKLAGVNVLPGGLLRLLPGLREVVFEEIHLIPDSLFTSAAKVTSLSITGSGLGSAPEILFFPLRNLRALNLSDSGVRNLSQTTFQAQLATLETLDLSNNQLRHIDVGEIFKGMTSLRSLNLSNNSLVDLDWDGFSSLASLDVAYNKIEGITGLLQINNPSLQEVSMLGNPLFCGCEVILALEKSTKSLTITNGVCASPPRFKDLPLGHETMLPACSDGNPDGSLFVDGQQQPLTTIHGPAESGNDVTMMTDKGHVTCSPLCVLLVILCLSVLLLSASIIAVVMCYRRARKRREIKYKGKNQQE